MHPRAPQPPPWLAGEIDREALGRLVFSDRAARSRLNAATHLPIYAELLRQLLWLWLTFKPVVVRGGHERPRGGSWCAPGAPQQAPSQALVGRLRRWPTRPELRRPLPSLTPHSLLSGLTLPPPTHTTLGLQVVDMPLMIETGSYKYVHLVVVVAASPQLQLSRLQQRNALSPEDAQARMDAQMPIAAKAKLADVLISNEGSLQQLEQQVQQASARLRRRARWWGWLTSPAALAAALVALGRLVGRL
jgi:dephospho-CoA kinase